MAGAGWRSFSAGAVLSASQVQTYLQDQVVQVYASAAARSSALGTAVATGMVSYRADGTVVEFYNGSAWVGVGVDSTLTNALLVSPIEKTTVSATASGGTVTMDLATQADLYYTTAGTANFTLNFRASSTVSLNTLLATGQSITAVFRNTTGATAYYPTAFQVDGSAVTPKWQGGTAPTAGNASAIDNYAFLITKTGSATFTVQASQTKFA